MSRWPERDNNNRQEDHQNCAHDIPCFFFLGGPEAEDSYPIPEYLIIGLRGANCTEHRP
jgi:hypothetical protein